jgi:hypothetical protein
MKMMTIEGVLARIQKVVDRNSVTLGFSDVLRVDSWTIKKEIEDIWKEYQRELRIENLNK